MKVSKTTLKYQLQRRFIVSVILVGLIFITLAIGLRYLTMRKNLTLRTQHTQILIENIIESTSILEEELNSQLLQEASNQAALVYDAYSRNEDMKRYPSYGDILYRVVDDTMHIIDSNYMDNLPTGFVPNIMLIKSSLQSPVSFYDEHIKMVTTAFFTGTSTFKDITILDADHSGAYVLYMPFTKSLLIEVLLDSENNANQISEFLSQKLNQVFDYQDLEGLILYNKNETIYGKGDLSGITENLLEKELDPLSSKFTKTIGTVQLSYMYHLNTEAEYRAFGLAVFWILLMFIVSVLLLYFITLRESAALLSPLMNLLETARQANAGRYDKRISGDGFIETTQMSETFNHMMDRIESLLDEKKNQEYKLREAILNEEQLELVDDIHCKEVISQVGSLESTLAETQRLYIQTVVALANAIEAKDIHTSGHCKRVMELSVKLAEMCKLSHESIENIRLGALLHDVGKLNVQEGILNKYDPLTEYERHVVQRHCKVGEEIIAEFEVNEEVKNIVLSHHEHYDGLGYPSGIKGENIIIGARIICLVDSFDAMRSIRPYRLNPMSLSESLQEIRLQAGKQFDPLLVELLTQIITSGEGMSYAEI